VSCDDTDDIIAVINIIDAGGERFEGISEWPITVIIINNTNNKIVLILVVKQRWFDEGFLKSCTHFIIVGSTGRRGNINIATKPQESDVSSNAANIKNNNTVDQAFEW
jgi:hypothetical protein